MNAVPIRSLTERYRAPALADVDFEPTDEQLQDIARLAWEAAAPEVSSTQRSLETELRAEVLSATRHLSDWLILQRP
jgi:hypothetical protein